MLARKEIGKGACHLIAPSGVLELGKKKQNLKTNRKWSDKKTVLFYKRTINKTDHTSALFMHSARLIAHQKRGCSTQRRRRRERCHERNDVGGAGFVKKLPGQAPAASLYFRPVQCGFGAQMWEKLRHKSIRTLKEKEKPRETLKRRFPSTDGCESESLSPRTFKLSSAI